MLRRNVRRDLSLQGFSRAAIDAADPELQRLLSPADDPESTRNGTGEQPERAAQGRPSSEETEAPDGGSMRPSDEPPTDPDPAPSIADLPTGSAVIAEASRAAPSKRTSRKSATPDQEAPDTKASGKSGGARGRVTGLVTVAAVLVAGGLYLGLDGGTISGWSTEVAREVARLRGVPYAPPIQIDLPRLDSAEFGDASLADADQQDAFLTWLGEGGSR